MTRLASPAASSTLRRIPSGIWALGCVSLLMDVSSEMIHGLLPVFLTTALGASGSKTHCALDDCAASSRRRHSTLAWISLRSIACCKSEVRRALRGSSNARVGADTDLERSAE